MSSSGNRPDDDATNVNRRDMLKLSSLAAIAGASAELQGCGPSHDPIVETDRLLVARSDDMALMEIGLVAITRSDDDATLSWDDSGVARLIVYLQPQHILEGAYWGGTNQPITPDDPVPTRISGGTRLVFRPNAVSGSIPFTLESILASLKAWIPVVDPRALPPDDVAEPSTLPPALPPVSSVGAALSRLRQRRNAATSPNYLRFGMPAYNFQLFPPAPPPWARPTDDTTHIELPFRLILSPSRFGRFLHPTAPVSGTGGTVGLWASRLASIGPYFEPAADRFDSHRTVRALWARDLDPPSGPIPGSAPVDAVRGDPFQSSPMGAQPSLRADDRAAIAVQSSHTGLEVPEQNISKPAKALRVDRLWLSALGGGLDVRGEWTDSCVPFGSQNCLVNLVKWVNKTTLGRDHYVEVQRSGYVWPTGNRAVYVEVTERQVTSSNKAVLHKRGYIVIGEVTRAWAPTTTGDDATWRRAPLRSITFLDTVIECAQITNPGQIPNQALVTVPGSSTAPARARVLVEDRLGRTHHTDVAMVWYTSPPTFDGTRAGTLNGLLEPELPMGDQRVAYADEGDPAGVMHETRSLRWEGTVIDNQVFPVLVEASLVIDAVRSLIQTSDAGAVATPMVLHDSYLTHGLGGSNPQQVLFGVASTAIKPMLDFASDSRRSGGFVAPNFEVGGLSVLDGPIGGDATAYALNGFDAATFFDGALPKLFGVLSLADMLSAAGAPSILTSAAEGLEGLLSDVDRLQRLGALNLSGPAAAAQQSLDDAVLRCSNALSAVATGDLDLLKSELESLRIDVDALEVQLAGLPAGTDPVLKSIQPLVSRLKVGLMTASSVVDSAMTLQDALERREVKLTWEAPLDDIPDLFLPNEPLVLEVLVNAGTGGVDMTARLDDFALSLFGLVTVPVERFSFLQRSGSKPDIDVVLGATEFLGMLKFVQALMEILPLDGFSDPPSIEVDETRLLASLSLPLPNLAVGVFSIENMNLSAALEVPFIGDSILFTFGFCSRDNPFVLTVMCVGGGGFFGIEVTPNGLRVVEVALEARASLSLDFGVASGSVSVAVGIYMNLHMGEADSPEMTLEGYVRIRGEVSVLGIVSASLTLSLTLSYQSAGNKMYGEAEMTIEVSVLCFSASVTVRCRRKLSGDNQDPTFLETMAPVDPTQPMLGANRTTAPWALYVNAFAA